ncbi:MAG TPA: prolyl oligopeptidase family serine peptidase, partial [Gemmatimonadales bacterium]|nr:prolyl oligopeptidase family serine peptidase [Gemmatimonadales bacterium]
TGRDRMLLDPDTLPKHGGSHWAIDYVTPSPDGKLVGYGASMGGSERTTLYLMDPKPARLLPDSISRVQFGPVNWEPNGRAFYYNRLNAASDTNPALRYRNSGVFRHVVGQPVERDQVMLEAGSTPSVPLEPDDFPVVVPVEGSPYVFAMVFHGVKNEITLYAVRAGELRGAATNWRKLVDVDDAVTGVDFHGSDVYLLTHKGAPRFRVLRIRADAPDASKAEVVVPEGGGVLTSIAVAKDALYIRELETGLGRVRRLAFGERGGARIALPSDGAISTLVTDRRKPGVLFPLQSWTRSPLWYQYTQGQRQPTDTRLLQPGKLDVSGYESVEVEVPSHDGVRVPLSIVYRKGLARDGSHPLLLDGYGAYGFTYDPGFSPFRLAWLERGGVFAAAHVRGGGEHGEPWHQAGQKATKPNTWKDFIACAEYLVRQGYTSPAHLAGTGTSAGGILIGRAITERPDLFRAAVPRVGVMNAIRVEHEPGGQANIPEFGTTTKEDEFQALREMDAVAHVRPGVRYPAVLLTAGINDSRVEAWQPAKMAAVLQEHNAPDRPVLLRVAFDAGHGMGLTKAQRVEEAADLYSFLLWQLGAGHEPATP